MTKPATPPIHFLCWSVGLSVAENRGVTSGTPLYNREFF